MDLINILTRLQAAPAVLTPQERIYLDELQYKMKTAGSVANRAALLMNAGLTLELAESLNLDRDVAVALRLVFRRVTH